MANIPETYHPNWLDQLDGRTATAQEMRRRYELLTNDLGGADRLSYQQRSLCTRALWLEAWLEIQERQLAEGQDFDAGKWTQGSNALLGLFRALGFEKVAKNARSINDIIEGARNAHK